MILSKSSSWPENSICTFKKQKQCGIIF
jgi:hypothetical protein